MLIRLCLFLDGHRILRGLLKTQILLIKDSVALANSSLYLINFDFGVLEVPIVYCVSFAQ